MKPFRSNRLAYVEDIEFKTPPMMVWAAWSQNDDSSNVSFSFQDVRLEQSEIDQKMNEFLTTYSSVWKSRSNGMTFKKHRSSAGNYRYDLEANKRVVKDTLSNLYSIFEGGMGKMLKQQPSSSNGHSTAGWKAFDVTPEDLNLDSWWEY